ncbi:MAG TPA: GspH/FimT family protein [Syntrophorhabdaceae bacterium]|nr:GspH/FimT family protein [Syntrophorhabdaceae bacterium]
MARGKGKKGDRRGTKGFTSIELIVVILVLSVLTASIIIKNPFTISDYSSIAADQLIADIQYVQMRAMGIGARQSIIFANGSGIYCVCHVSTCTYATCSSTGEQKTLPGGVVVSSLPTFGATITFNTLGEPIYGAGTIRLSNTKDVTIYAITGKVE